MHEVNTREVLLAQAVAARDAGDLSAAERLFARIAELDPSDPEPHHHLGGIYERQGRLDEAVAAYRKTLDLAPDAPATQRVLGVLLLSLGRYAEGFALADARHQLAGIAKPALPFREWRGEPIGGKRLLIWPEQGFGDQIQFARFAPVARSLGAHVTLLCHQKLARLFRGCLEVEVIAAQGAVEFPDPDFWIMTGSMPWRLGVEPEAIPGKPYLWPVSSWPKLDGDVKVGLATRGNPAHANDAHRSLPAQVAERLHGLRAAVYDLHPDASGADDFADTAAIIEQLDLVIAVDTSVAHLAGAMGKPCWVLLPALNTDWRWFRDRTDSPWYPSMTLFRQGRDEDWNAVVDRVEAAFDGLR